MITDVLSILLLVASALFFLGGTVGLLRFPDTFSRLHALTKADNLGLGLLVVALALHAGSFSAILKLALIWLLVMAINSSAIYLMARHAAAMVEREERQG